MRTYSLRPDHERGGSKANGFASILGIDLTTIDYAIQVMQAGIASTPIALVEPRPSEAVFCLVQFRVAGLGRYSHRTALMRTGWHLAGPTARPRLVTAYLRPRGRK